MGDFSPSSVVGIDNWAEKLAGRALTRFTVARQFTVGPSRGHVRARIRSALALALAEKLAALREFFELPMGGLREFIAGLRENLSDGMEEEEEEQEVHANGAEEEVEEQEAHADGMAEEEEEQEAHADGMAEEEEEQEAQEKGS